MRKADYKLLDTLVPLLAELESLAHGILNADSADPLNCSPENINKLTKFLEKWETGLSSVVHNYKEDSSLPKVGFDKIGRKADQDEWLKHVDVVENYCNSMRHLASIIFMDVPAAALQKPLEAERRRTTTRLDSTTRLDDNSTRRQLDSTRTTTRLESTRQLDSTRR